jgi:hypothetical protein
VIIGLPSPLVELLPEHRAEQDRERAEAAQLWQEGGWVFTTPTSEPTTTATSGDQIARIAS